MNKPIAFILLFFVQFLIQQEVFAQETQSNVKNLRILCYNIHHANPPSKPELIDIDAIVKVIKESDADIVAMQEVDKNTLRSGNIDEAKLIAEKTGLHYQFFKAIDHDGGDYGLAIFSRYPLKKTKLIQLPQQIVAEKRILAYATIAIGKQKIVFANTHLDATKTNENRIAQMEYILKVMEDITLPVILCGDLNSIAGSEAIKLLDTQFKRTCIDNCPGTVPVVNPRRTIDYIASKNLIFQLVDYKVLDETYASDHRAISATFKIK
jgi:endonuclease/exonuclease/phosphatase family metal-dependent hydrolase